MHAKHYPFYTLVFLTCLCLLNLFQACKSGTLDPTGPYAGDKTLYDIDASIAAGKATVDAFLNFEKANHDLIVSTHPEIHAFAEKLRVSGKKDFQTAVEARDVYKAAATPANKAAFDAVWKTVADELAQAGSYLSTAIAKP